MEARKRLVEDERGASLVEYALVGGETGSSFSKSADEVAQARAGA